MRPNKIREIIAAGSVATTAWMSTSGAYLAEVLSHSGFDAVTVDLQHGMYGLDTAIALLQAVSSGPAVPMARCSGLDPAEIGKLLDGGAYGIICPNIDDVDSCSRFVAACRYPPTGVRSYGPARGLLYGGPDYVTHADATVMTWAMIESVAGLSNLDAILEVPGLDGVYVGPNDLALSIGQLPDSNSPSAEVRAYLRAVKDAAHAHGVAVGAYCGSASSAAELAAEGFDLVTPGSDVVLVREAASLRLGMLRRKPTDGSTAAAY